MVQTGFPPLAPVPPSPILKSIPEHEWKACLDAWIASVEFRLNMRDEAFEPVAIKDQSTSLFLLSYFGGSPDYLGAASTTKAVHLRRLCFLLTRRLLLVRKNAPLDVLDWRFLGKFAECYHSTSALKSLLVEVWTRDAQVITESIEKGKSLIMLELSSSNRSNIEASLRLLTVLASSLPAVGQVLMTGSDYIDSLSEAYSTTKDQSLQKAIVAQVYAALLSLLKISPPATSLLLDQLFSLKDSAKVDLKVPRSQPTLLSALVCGSGVLSRLEAQLAGSQHQKRGDNIIASLRSYRSECKHLHQPFRPRRRVDKGKGRAIETPAGEEFHVHKMSLVSQVQDLFPDLGSGYIVQLLDYYGEDIETVISNLVEGTLPQHLRDADQSAQLQGAEAIHDIAPRATPSPPPGIARKNIHDNDDFDRLNIPSSNLHKGRANAQLTADDLLADKSSHAVSKAAIMSALAAFDSDDDERDDTYDVADVGGTVDAIQSGAPDGVEGKNREDNQDSGTTPAEIKLYELYQSNPSLFGRDSATRRSQQRIALRKDTGMTDEAIEGWAMMLSRDPKRRSKLERSVAFSAGSGNPNRQADLPPTSYRRPAPSEVAGGEGSEAESSGGRGSGRGRGRGRGGRGGGRGRGGPHGGGGTETPGSGGPSSALDKRRKDANKGSRANHNRRDQRAKKMARGGL